VKTDKLLERLQPFIVFRNMLVHQYWRVKDEVFLQNMRKGVNPDFSRALCIHLQGTLGRCRSFLLQVPDNAANGCIRQRPKGENISV